MKPTYEELLEQLENAQREFRSADITMQNLEAKCEKLAAENAGLKKFCKDAAFDADYESELGMERGGFTDALNDIKTPATDAFLAEVRAQESERIYESILDNPSVTDMGSLVDWIEQNANDSVAFAAQLRKGDAL